MIKNSTYPLALDGPKEKVILIDEDIVNQAIRSSKESPRKRIILPFHKGATDNLHRMLNALQPMSYIQPHRHLFPPKAESIIVLRGAIYYFEFNQRGDIENCYLVSAGSFTFGIDTEPEIYHTFLAAIEDTVVFEVKPGPYERSSDKDFASWAPPEGSPSVDKYLQKLYHLAGQTNKKS